jgi:hypothetical protein
MMSWIFMGDLRGLGFRVTSGKGYASWKGAWVRREEEEGDIRSATAFARPPIDH